MISISGCIISFIFPLKRIIPVKRISIPTFRPEYIIILWINLICIVEPPISTFSIRFGLKPFVFIILVIAPTKRHWSPDVTDIMSVSCVLSIKKEGKNKIKSLILLIPILYNWFFVAGPTPGKPSKSLSSNLFCVIMKTKHQRILLRLFLSVHLLVVYLLQPQLLQGKVS